MITDCVDCGVNERQDLNTFLCGLCQHDYFSELRSKYGRSNKKKRKNPRRRKNKSYDGWLTVARENGMTSTTFYRRAKTMSLEEAATTPLKKPREVYQYTKDGKFVRKHNSSEEAEIATGVSRQMINKVCNGRRKTARGYVFRYEEDMKVEG